MKKEFLSRPITKEYSEGWERIFGKWINPPVMEKNTMDEEWIDEKPEKV